MLKKKKCHNETYCGVLNAVHNLFSVPQTFSHKSVSIFVTFSLSLLTWTSFQREHRLVSVFNTWLEHNLNYMAQMHPYNELTVTRWMSVWIKISLHEASCCILSAVYKLFSLPQTFSSQSVVLFMQPS